MKKWVEVVACKEENSKGVTGRVNDKGKRYGIEGKAKDPEGGRKRDSRSREGVRIGARRSHEKGNGWLSPKAGFYVLDVFLFFFLSFSFPFVD